MARDDAKGKGRRNNRGGDKPKKEFEEVLLEVRRVTRVTTGGRQLSFRAIIIIGNRKGKIALWVAKWSDVSIAVTKATHEAYKSIVTVPITDQFSVPYELTHKYKAAKVKLIPAASGTGLKAGSSVRTVLWLAWYNNILSKIMWTNNKLNNAIAAIQALAKYKVGKFPEKAAKAPVKEGAWGEETVEVITDKKTAKKTSVKAEKKTPAKKKVTKEAKEG